MNDLKEAEKLEKKGNKAIGKSFFGLIKHKDYGSAAYYYEDALKIYLNNNKHNDAIRIYNKLINVNHNLKDNWQISKNYEGIIKSKIILNDYNEQEIISLITEKYNFNSIDKSEIHFISFISDLIANSNLNILLKYKIFSTAHKLILDTTDNKINREEFLYNNLYYLVENNLEDYSYKITNILENEINYCNNKNIKSIKHQNYCFTILFIYMYNNNVDKFNEYLKAFENDKGFNYSKEYLFIQEIINKTISKDNILSNHIFSKLIPSNIAINRKNINFDLNFGEFSKNNILSNNDNNHDEEFNPF